MPEARRLLAVVALLSIGLAACRPDPGSGPAEIQLGRTTCEHCAMAIGERRFAAQVRAGEDRRARAFDDLGCALLWLDANGGSPQSPAPEIWVRDTADEHWVDARSVRYRDGLHTPMGYGFATAAPDDSQPDAETWSLAEVTRRVPEIDGERRQGHGR